MKKALERVLTLMTVLTVLHLIIYLSENFFYKITAFSLQDYKR